jgi:hypothetical protein
MAFIPRLKKVGLVILATSNNPRLLNADFLKRNEIVPEDMEVAETLVTPPFAQVVFKNGVTIQLLENQFLVETVAPEKIEWMSVVPKIASKFLETLKHVEYGAAGVNFHFVSETPLEGNAEKHLIDSFLKAGEWMEYYGGLSSTVVELRYRLGQPQVNVKIGVTKAGPPEGSQKEKYFVSVNIHHEFFKEQLTERKDFICSVGRLYREAENFVGRLPITDRKENGPDPLH